MDLPSPSIIFRVGFCLPRVEHVIVNLDVSSTKAELCQQTALLQAVARGNTAQTTFILNCYPEEVNSPDSVGQMLVYPFAGAYSSAPPSSPLSYFITTSVSLSVSALLRAF